MKTGRGFTLIEMLVVLSIVGILAMAAQPLLELSVQRTRELALRESLRSLRQAIDAYKKAADEHRIAVPADGSGYPPSLEVLVSGVPLLTPEQSAQAAQAAQAAVETGAPPTVSGPFGTPPSGSGSLSAAPATVPTVGTGSSATRRLILLRRLPRDPFADPELPAAATWTVRAYGAAPDDPSPGRDVFDVMSRSERRALDGSRLRDW